MSYSSRALKKKLKSVTVDGITFKDSKISFAGVKDSRPIFNIDISGKRMAAKRRANQRLAKHYHYSMIE